MSEATYLVAVDWGTSHLRAYLCEKLPGQPLSLFEKARGPGVNKANTNFETTLLETISPWVADYGKFPIVMAGQIGSSIGWRETRYLPCPISPKEVATAGLRFEVNDHEVTIIPGLSCKLCNDNYDVMRGEEIQVLGWLQLDPKHRAGEHLICLPGTHTKWVMVQDGKIQNFKTAMTGELYDLLTTNSILIQKNSSAFDLEAFNQGANFTLKSELGTFTHGLFSVRSKQLFGELEPTSASSYLSGLLIGSDVRAALNAEEWELMSLGKVSVIGAGHLTHCFAQVLSNNGLATNICEDVDATLLGFDSIYQQITSSELV